ncbi:hypothetical protein EKO23_22250 [Nocardioides guangzhouensis]|uniref:Uncharacterized protein n=1 Tax=Nocardioides guangzhouensis TaxID=2497878 RepID=A0A4Q4Z598_9ACTN|nr:hypothetical protein [Nocardioides guangzhouensis]RYP82201.1 hypothetical protein EKO23_22250 [Nocardioides guangzhouensis]
MDTSTSNRITRLTTALTAASVLLVAGPQAADAAGPDRVTVDLHEVHTDEFASDACGTEVVLTITGSAEFTLWRNDQGLVERELDRFPGAFVSWTAPETEKSVKTRADLVSHWDYGTGAVLGGPVTYTFQGMFFHLPGGSSAFAGREVSVGVVDSFDNGVPGVENGTLVSLVGHAPEDFDFIEALCGLLT